MKRRTEFELRHFVVGAYGTPARRYMKCKKELEDNTLPEEEKRVLQQILSEFGREYTWDDVELEEPQHWKEYIGRRVNQDITAYGRPTTRTQELAYQTGILTDPGREYIRDVEDRFLAQEKIRITVCIPTAIPEANIKEDTFDHLTNWRTEFNIFKWDRQVLAGFPTDDAYNRFARLCLDNEQDFMLCIEDDHEIPEGVFNKLWNLYREKGPKAIVSAWYRRRMPPHNGAPVVMQNGIRNTLDADGKVHECWIVPQGFTIIPVNCFREIPYPWFKTTSLLTQDAFFCYLARGKGYKLYCDTSAKIVHVDRETGKRLE